MRRKYDLRSCLKLRLFNRLSSWTWKKWAGPKQLEDKTTKSLMMLPYVYPSCCPNATRSFLPGTYDSTDYVLVQDKSFKKHVKAYANDIDLFFKE